MTEQEQDPQATGDTTTEQPADGAGQTPGMFSQADVDRIIADRLERERKRTEAALAKQQAEAERKAAEEQGQFRTLYERAQQQAAELEGRLKDMTIAQMRREVADRHQLPPVLAARLRGETVEEMDADARELLAALPRPAAPNINSGPGVGAAPRSGAVSEQELRERAVRLGLKPETLINLSRGG